MAPNLDETYYAFTDSMLALPQLLFHKALTEVSQQYTYSLDNPFMPLDVTQAPEPPDPAYTQYELTIPASIQY